MTVDLALSWVGKWKNGPVRADHIGQKFLSCPVISHKGRAAPPSFIGFRKFSDRGGSTIRDQYIYARIIVPRLGCTACSPSVDH